MQNIFDYLSYKKYLKDYCSDQRGNLSRLANAADVQKSYLSTCLSGKSHLTLDHAYGIALYLNMSNSEQNYFFTLIEKEKAASIRLQRNLTDKLKEMSREAYRLKNLQSNSLIVSDTASTSLLKDYYLNWLFIAVHSLTSIPAYQKAEKISHRLNISLDLTVHILRQLENTNLIIKKANDTYEWSSGNLHLEDSSPVLATHHGNWRMRASDNCQKGDREALHYSVVQTLSKEDFEILKKKIANFIKSFNKISDPSNPEEAFCFNIDFFKI